MASILKNHCGRVLCAEKGVTRITVRRRHLLEDTLNKFRSGIDLNRGLSILFVGESAVDAGGPLKEFLFLAVSAIANNNSLFCGSETKRVPRHNLVELEKKSYYYIGAIIALSLAHGGPAPQFFTKAVADYIVYGVQNVRATINDIPDENIKEKLQLVFSLIQYLY